MWSKFQDLDRVCWPLVYRVYSNDILPFRYKIYYKTTVLLISLETL
jgi:hypothetical protein